MVISHIKKNIGVVLSAGMLLELMPVSIRAASATKIVLDSKILTMFDGVPFALDGDAFDDMLHVRKAVHLLLLGKKAAGCEKLQGLYLYNGSFCTINELALIEQQAGCTPALQAVVAIAKQDLVGIAEPFMNRARGTKHFLLPIMNDWAKKRNRENSLLLKWHHEEEGKELDMFKKDITSFAAFKGFCDDLILFMEDLMYNCPKGFNQLLTKKRAAKNEQ